MSETGSLQDEVQLAETLGIAGVRGPQVSILWGTVKHIQQDRRGAYQQDTLKALGLRCPYNLYQVRTIVDHQICWSAIFTLAHKHKSLVQNIIPKYSKDSNIVNQEGGKTLAEFPNNTELGKLEPSQDPENKEHSTTSLV
ncbi:hypothetical protein FEM48_ZijujUnG0013700 [Ziziphus jujuba var. spinosa]|uniref:Uncharacterized protein n=1 Tax=Ziziphus jujuba var. spinosa TaxID=714518 RepID=A0A978U9X8_ZIZJJ|nr:hypothetical protein FEM48_ZijujUnG0013700 [Ziziphus jujuba var. spinosa]